MDSKFNWPISIQTYEELNILEKSAFYTLGTQCTDIFMFNLLIQFPINFKLFANSKFIFGFHIQVSISTLRISLKLISGPFHIQSPLCYSKSRKFSFPSISNCLWCSNRVLFLLLRKFFINLPLI